MPVVPINNIIKYNNNKLIFNVLTFLVDLNFVELLKIGNLAISTLSDIVLDVINR